MSSFIYISLILNKISVTGSKVLVESGSTAAEKARSVNDGIRI